MHAPVLFLMLRAAVEHQPTSGAPTLGDPLANLAATPGAFSGTLGHSRTTTDGVLARKKKGNGRAAGSLRSKDNYDMLRLITRDVIIESVRAKHQQ